MGHSSLRNAQTPASGDDLSLLFKDQAVRWPGQGRGKDSERGLSAHRLLRHHACTTGQYVWNTEQPAMCLHPRNQRTGGVQTVCLRPRNQRTGDVQTMCLRLRNQRTGGAQTVCLHPRNQRTGDVHIFPVIASCYLMWETRKPTCCCIFCPLTCVCW